MPEITSENSFEPSNLNYGIVEGSGILQ